MHMCREVVVEEDGEVEQQQAAPGEEIVGDDEEIAEPIVAEGQPRRSTEAAESPINWDRIFMMCNVSNHSKEEGGGVM